jgi:prepilin-type N-terminal cleavage/methylation domain-containing protein
MKKQDTSICTGPSGFTLTEVLIVLFIMALAATGFIFLQKNTWSGTRQSNKVTIVSQVLEKQIEKLRMQIAQDPETNFPSLVAAKNNTIETDVNGVDVHWTVRAATDPLGAVIDNVREVELKAKWRTDRWDSLVVITCIAKNF